MSLPSLKWQIGVDTDVGGGFENQDDSFVWEQPSLGMLVIGVLDGHGRETGKVAAVSARARLLQYCQQRYLDFEADPCQWLIEAHRQAHVAIKEAFKQCYEAQGYSVEETDDGYLLRKCGNTHVWSCIHGGSACTIVVVCGYKLFVANVGDSTATMCTSAPLLKKSMLMYSGDGAALSRTVRGCVCHTPLCECSTGTATVRTEARGDGADHCKKSPACSFSPSTDSDSGSDRSESFQRSSRKRRGEGTVTCTEMETDTGTRTRTGVGSSTDRADDEALSNTLVISFDHSPESVHEFCRLRDSYPNTSDPRFPSLLAVYDCPSYEKARCDSIFKYDEEGSLIVTKKGKYYKNVRNEWASLVSTPMNARFQDALAFTRTLGDLHLQTYGVTYLPQVQCVDLIQLFDNINRLSPVTTTSSDSTPSLLGLIVASDGVWDNWCYEDVTKFIFDSSCVGAVLGKANGAQRVAQSLIHRNDIFAKRNFGSQADNATAVVLYLSCDSALPVSLEAADATEFS